MATTVRKKASARPVSKLDLTKSLKIGASAKPSSKSEVFGTIAHHVGIHRRDVGGGVSRDGIDDQRRSFEEWRGIGPLSAMRLPFRSPNWSAVAIDTVSLTSLLQPIEIVEVLLRSRQRVQCGDARPPARPRWKTLEWWTW